MSDVAALAGLHPSSVSLALRDSPAIPEETRARVRRIAEELGYRRDPLLETFNFRRRAGGAGHPSQSVVFIADAASWEQYHTEPVRRDLLEGVAAACRSGGIGFDRFLFGSGGLTANRLQQILRTRNTDSVVVGPLACATREISLDWSRYFAAGLETFELEPALDLYSSNYRQAGILAVEELTRLGYRRIGVVLPPASKAGRGALLRMGMLTARECGAGVGAIEFHEEPLAGLGSWIERQGVDAVVGPDAAFAAEFALRCGGVAYVVLDLADAPSGVAGVRHHHVEVGARAVAALIQKRYINRLGLSPYPTRSFVPVEWEDGASAPGRSA